MTKLLTRPDREKESKFEERYLLRVPFFTLFGMILKTKGWPLYCIPFLIMHQNLHPPALNLTCTGGIWTTSTQLLIVVIQRMFPRSIRVLVRVLLGLSLTAVLWVSLFSQAGRATELKSHVPSSCINSQPVGSFCLNWERENSLAAAADAKIRSRLANLHRF